MSGRIRQRRGEGVEGGLVGSIRFVSGAVLLMTKDFLGSFRLFRVACLEAVERRTGAGSVGLEDTNINIKTKPIGGNSTPSGYRVAGESKGGGHKCFVFSEKWLGMGRARYARK